MAHADLNMISNKHLIAKLFSFSTPSYPNIDRNRRPVGVGILEQLEAKSRGLMKEVDVQALLFGLCAQSGFTDQMMELAKKRRSAV